MSATNVARAGKRGNICVNNNVSSFARAFKFGFYMRMVKGPECKTEIKKAVINNQYYLKLLFLEKSFDEYPEKF